MGDLMDSSENYVKVSIYGQEYTINAPADPTYIKNIAEIIYNKHKTSNPNYFEGKQEFYNRISYNIEKYKSWID